MGQFEGALTTARAIVAGSVRLDEDDLPHAARLLVATAHHLTIELHRPDDAEPLLREAARLFRQIRDAEGELTALQLLLVTLGTRDMLEGRSRIERLLGHDQYSILIRSAELTIDLAEERGDLRAAAEERMALSRLLAERAALSSGDPTHPVSDHAPDAAQAAVARGVSASESGQHYDALKEFDMAVRLLRVPSRPVRREELMQALFFKGNALLSLDRQADAVAAYDEALAQLTDLSDADVREQAATVLFNKGVALSATDDRAAELECYDRILSFELTEVPPPRRVLAMTCAYRGEALRRLLRDQEAVSALDRSLELFADASDAVAIEEIVRAQVNKGLCLDRLGDYIASLDMLTDLLKRFGHASELPVRRQLARALFFKATLLGGLGRYNDAAASLSQLLSRFADVAEPDWLEFARVNLRAIRNQ
jgi:tetratricopeptide (TPR) repeat protein